MLRGTDHTTQQQNPFTKQYKWNNPIIKLRQDFSLLRLQFRQVA